MKKKFWTGRLKTILIVALIVAICAAVTLAITSGTSAIENVVGTILSPIRAGVASIDRLAERYYNYMFRYETLEAENAEMEKQILAMQEDIRDAEQLQRRAAEKEYPRKCHHLCSFGRQPGRRAAGPAAPSRPRRPGSFCDRCRLFCFSLRRPGGGRAAGPGQGDPPPATGRRPADPATPPGRAQPGRIHGRRAAEAGLRG